MPRIASRDEIAARLHAKGHSADQINALFLAFDIMANDRVIDPDMIERIESAQAAADRGEQNEQSNGE